MIDRSIAEKAKQIARRAGYDPDQLVVKVDTQEHYDWLAIGCAPVTIPDIKPAFMMFIDAALAESDCIAA